MKTSNKAAPLIASILLALPMMAGAESRSADKRFADTGTSCRRDSARTPRTAAGACEGAVVQAAVERVSFSADVDFDFDRSIVQPQARADMDAMLGKMHGVNVDIAIATGRAYAIGTAAYNQKLSVRRADAVRDYLVSRGIDRSHVFTEGKGAAHPVADNKTAEGRASNRRVEIELAGQRDGP